MLNSKSSEVVVLFLPLFRLVLCTSNSSLSDMHPNLFFLTARVWEQNFKSLVFKKMGGGC